MRAHSLEANLKMEGVSYGAQASQRCGRVPDSGRKPRANTARSGELYAALDLGTNSCRMLIAQPKGSQFHVVDSFSKSVQLGQGLESTGRLSRASMNRTIHAMRICQLKSSNARRATDASCRHRSLSARAERVNFIRQVQRETGLQLEIIKPEEEARLAVISCAPLVSTNTEQLLVVDIGGGSTELVWIDLALCRNANAHAPSCGCTPVSIRPKARLPRQRLWIGYPCRWAWPRCAISSAMLKTMRPASH